MFRGADAEFQSALFFRQYFRATEPPNHQSSLVCILSIYRVSYTHASILNVCIERAVCRYAHPTYIIARSLNDL